MRIGFPAGMTKWEKELRQRAVLVRAILTRRNEMGQAAQVIAYMDKERPWEAAMEYNALGQETSRLVSGSVYSSWEY